VGGSFTSRPSQPRIDYNPTRCVKGWTQARQITSEKGQLINPWMFVGAALWLMCSVGICVANELIVGQASVVDGDTIEIHGVRIRLQGIDAPESRQVCQDSNAAPYRCGQVSALSLSNWIGRQTVDCRSEGVDRYGRQIAKCFVGGQDMQAWMVENGLAMAFRRYSLDYVAQEDAARDAHRGLWAGSFDAPWDWRRSSN
jgi:endonuclease YncB( thermonuclease family)